MKLALIGDKGMLARKVREFAPIKYDVIGFDLPDFDLTNGDQVDITLRELRPTLIINCAAFTNVDDAEVQEKVATQINADGPGHLAKVAKEIGSLLVHISTDYVFSGDKNSPYTETDLTRPLSAYGRSKLAGEEAILNSGLKRFIIIRTSWLYGPGGKNFVETIIRLAKEREELRIVADQYGTPTYTGDLAEAIFNLVGIAQNTKGEDRHIFGFYHFSNCGECSWYQFAEEIINQVRLHNEDVAVKKITPISTSEFPLPAARPPYSIFDKEKYKRATNLSIPSWADGLARYMLERQA